ncbi:YadA-like family protein [Megasphaera sp.]|uniref:YadA-like family protein n=1 Tax=Megasphaera sp. TaxID=2023260 RepID=UPI0035219228
MKKKHIATILLLCLACGQTTVFAASRTEGSTGIVIEGDNNTVSSSNSVTLGNNISSLGGANVAIGYKSKAGNQEKPLGPNNANGATAVGTGSQAVNYRATALGDYTVASGTDSLGLGTTAQATGDRSIAAGLSSQASGVNAIAIGDKAVSSSNDSVAIGEKASATNSQSIAIGSASSASGSYSVAIGLNAKATDDWSVALGNSSETSEAVSTSTMTVGGKTYQTAGGSATGTISVGNETVKRTITNVAAGRVTDTSTDAINGSQLFATNQSVDANTQNIAANAKNIAKGMNFAADTGTTYNAQLGDIVSIKGDGENLSTSVDMGTITVYMSDTPVFTSVTASTIAGNTIKAGDTVTLSHQGADMGGTKITHLKDGDISPTSTDAVNGSQLYSTENRINLLDSQVNHLGSQINRVGAGAAALAALHPLDFDPDDKWDFAAGYGNYKNANAVAIGAYYRPNEDVMFNVGGSFSGGENMVNAGISWKFGQKNNVSRSRVSVAKDVLALQQQVAVLTKELEAYKSVIGNNGNASMKRNINFPDVPENHWAYTYVKTLADKGYLKGYPDGEFKGNRALTRYEYAAIIYCALQNGAPSDGNMIRSMDEFGPEISKARELDCFQVDRISGKDNDCHKVERIIRGADPDRADRCKIRP